MRGEIPDRVPVMCQLSLGHYFLNTDDANADIWFDSATFAAALVELARRYRFDGILVNLPGRPDNWTDYLQSRHKRENGEERLVFDGGIVVDFPHDDMPRAEHADGRPLERADVDALVKDDTASWAQLPGYLWNTIHTPFFWERDDPSLPAAPGDFPDYMCSTLRIVRQNAPDLSVHGEVFSPFTHLMELFGYEQALMALLDRPGRCKALLERFAQSVCARIEHAFQVDLDAMLVSSAFAGAGFIGLDMYREFVAPYEAKLYDRIHAFGRPAYVHTCGAIGDRLEMMADAGADGIDTLDPPPLGNVLLEDAKARVGDRVFFKGNLDSVSELLRGDDETVDNAVRYRLRVGKPGGRYILSTACSVAPHVSPGRLERLVRWADELGRYD